jgi:hypothetical protein
MPCPTEASIHKTEFNMRDLHPLLHRALDELLVQRILVSEHYVMCRRTRCATIRLRAVARFRTLLRILQGGSTYVSRLIHIRILLSVHTMQMKKPWIEKIDLFRSSTSC